MYISFLFGVVTTAQQLPTLSGNVLHSYLYNPAVAGNQQFVDIRLAHRSQWLGMDGGPNTQIVSAQSSIDKKPMGVGGYIVNDITGIFSATHIGGTYAYHLLLNEEENTRLSFGLTLSGAQYRINGNKVNLYHDNDALIDAAKSSQFKFNGAFGAYLFNERYFLGLSATNLIPADVQFFDATVAPQVPHFYLMGARNYYFGRVKLQPSILINYINGNPIQFDARLQTELLGLGYFTAGYRYQDALVLGLGFDITPDIRLAYYYDLTLSNMSAGNTGSHELTLSFDLYYNPQYKYMKPRYKWWGNTGEKGGKMDNTEEDE